MLYAVAAPDLFVVVPASSSRWKQWYAKNEQQPRQTQLAEPAGKGSCARLLLGSQGLSTGVSRSLRCSAMHS